MLYSKISTVKCSPLGFFLLGCVAAQKVQLLGEFYLGELGFIAFFIISVHKLKKADELYSVFLLSIAWSFFQLMSDFYNEVEWARSVKGVLTPLVFSFTACGIYVYFKSNSRQLPHFLMGATVASLLPTYIYTYDYFALNYWKWGVGSVVLYVFSIWFTFYYKEKSNFPLFIFLMVFASFGLINDSRSLSLFPLFAFVLYWIAKSNTQNFLLWFFGRQFAWLKFVIALSFAVFAFNFLFSAIFSSEFVLKMLPEESARKFSMQAAGDYGVLLGGRSELLVSFEAFLDKPVLGHGSWAKDEAGYQDRLALLKYQLGYSEMNFSTYTTDLIPAHSYLMGSLVWSGFMGGLFWIAFSRKMVIWFASSIPYLGYFYHLSLVLILWAVLFSPFGASARWSTAMIIAAMYCHRFSKPA